MFLGLQEHRGAPLDLLVSRELLLRIAGSLDRNARLVATATRQTQVQAVDLTLISRASLTDSRIEP